MDTSTINWWETLLGALGGAFAAVVGLFGWFGKKLQGLDARIEEAEKFGAECRAHRGVQTSQHQDNLRHLEDIEDRMRTIDRKQDRHMELLAAMIAGRKTEFRRTDGRNERDI